MSRWDDFAWRWKEFKYQWGEFVSRCEEFGQSPRGKATLISGVVIAGIFILYSLSSFFGESEVAKLSRQRTFVDAATGRAFQYELQPGVRFPVPAPSGQSTGYPAEFCYWAKDGSQRSEPFPVLLNQYIGKSEPTFCPDCGRLVSPQSPPPYPAQKPPPTQAEYGQRRGEGKEEAS